MISDDNSGISQFVTLAQWRQGRIVLQQNAMRNLNNFNKGQINIVCYENFTGKDFQVLNFGYKNTSRRNDMQNCMLIQTSPRLIPRINKYVFFSQIKSSVPAAIQSLHLLASCISNIILVLVQPQSNAKYLGVTRQIQNGQYKNNNRNNNRNGIKNGNVASLLCLMPNNVQGQEFIKDSTDKLISKLESQNILNEVLNTYTSTKGLQCSQISLISATPTFQNKIFQQIQIMMTMPKQNDDLMYGPILTRYIQNITKQLNTQNNQLNLYQAQDEIAIDQGYEAYKSGVKKYHDYGLKLIDTNSKPDNNQLQIMMNSAKSKAFQQFYAIEGSQNVQFRRLLQDYTNSKNNQIINTYSSQQWNRNLQILQVQSKGVLDRISATGTKDQTQIMSYIDQMTKNYEQNAKGPQKYQILNDYMKVFMPIAFQGDPEKQARLRSELKRNQQLRQQMAQLTKKKSGGCCSSCSIM